MSDTNQAQNNTTTQAIEISIRLGLLFMIMAWCLQILGPFISIVAWGAIIAVAIYPLFLKLENKLGGRTKLAVTLIAVLGIAIILIPVVSLSVSAVEGGTRLGQEISTGQVTIAPPTESVKEWPIIGKKVYKVWYQASDNLKATLEKYPDQLKAAGTKLLGIATGLGKGLLQFIISTLIAAVFLSNVEGARNGVRKLARRLSAEHGHDLVDLSTATIRSVAVGVIGIAFIQAVLGGLGMMFVGVPAAGLLAIVILVLAIAQLPPILVLGPVAVYVFSAESTMVATTFLVWSLIVSFSDAALKPLLLGRGVNVPMLVILLGAIGGMISSGIVGLFIGAVILGMGYSLIKVWIDWGNEPDEKPEEPEESVSVNT